MYAINELYNPYAINTPFGFPTPYLGLGEAEVVVDPRSVLSTSNVLVVVLVGQSNSGNMALGYQYVSHNPGKLLTLDVFSGLLTNYREPCLGATGTGGHWIGDAGDRLIDSGLYDRVIVVPAAAIGGASVEQFAPGVFSNLRHRIYTCTQRVRDLGLQVSCYNYGLGESASGYPEASFSVPLNAMVNDVRSNGLTAPWIMDITTYHNGIVNPGAVAALQNIVNGTDILGGVDTDDLTKELGYRLDEGGAWVHLNQAGCQVKALRKYNNLVAIRPFLRNGLIT